MHPRSPCQGFGGSILLISYQPLSLPIRLRRAMAHAWADRPSDPLCLPDLPVCRPQGDCSCSCVRVISSLGGVALASVAQRRRGA
jgi:hypothetical protein